MQTEKKIISVSQPGGDSIELQIDGEKNTMAFIGCFEFTRLISSYRAKFGNDVRKWPVPSGASHSEMIIREFLLQLKGTWDYPYKDEEICHCRHVKTQTVDHAVLAGAHTHDLAMQWTGCSTACGTCKPDVEKIINYRLAKVASTAAD